MLENKHLDYLMNIYNKEQNHGSMDKFVKIYWTKTWKKWNYIFKKLSTPLTTTQKISPEGINLYNMFLTKHEIEILKLGLSSNQHPNLIFVN